MKSENQICFDVDTEGLNPAKDRITLIGTKSIFEEKLFTERSEEKLLEAFWDYLEAMAEFKLIGFNCHSFDIPFLKTRSMKHGISIPELKKSVIDLRRELANGNNKVRGTLQEYAKMAGYEPEFHGFFAEHIPLLWEENSFPELRENFLQDARMTYHVYKKAEECGIL